MERAPLLTRCPAGCPGRVPQEQTVSRSLPVQLYHAGERSPSPPSLSPAALVTAPQVPGQTVAMHLDAPYFWGASRVSVPQWLLVSMVFSGLFRDKFVDQVQVVPLPPAFGCLPLSQLTSLSLFAGGRIPSRVDG